MTTNRIYTPAKSPEEAMAELKRCAGTQFDNEVVEAFTEWWQNKFVINDQIISVYSTEELKLNLNQCHS
jgi:HD-GYP domain-containing protein (c-di-GMP phosphodiesterase class II)